MGDPNVGWDRDPETGEKLSGHAKANAARAAVVKGAKDKPRTPDENNPLQRGA